MKKLALLLFIAPFLANAQEKGIHFDHGSSWGQIQARAKAEHKFIFMDCFTTWCGPCRYMSSTIFPMDEVGNYMNDKFICVGVQLDTTDSDNDEVKSWYQDGHDIAAKYNIRAYPTYLFFDENGNAVHRSVGSSPADAFLAKAKDALNPETQYYTLLAKYNSGQHDSALLRKTAMAALDAYDMNNARKISDEYLATQSDLFTKANLELIGNLTESSTDKGFDLMLHNPEKVDAVLGQGVAEQQVMGIIMREEFYKKVPQNAASVDWQKISSTIKDKYPAYADEVIAKAKVVWYQNVKDWPSFKTAVSDYVDKYGSKVSANELNNYAWAIFQGCDDATCIQQALEWSKKSFADNNEPGYIDTYANLLYKLGKKDEAISWETKAMNLAPDGDKKGFQQTIDKMKSGEKTWN